VVRRISESGLRNKVEDGNVFTREETRRERGKKKLPQSLSLSVE